MLCQALLQKLKVSKCSNLKADSDKKSNSCDKYSHLHQMAKCKITNLFSWAYLTRRADLIDTNRHHIPGPRLHLTEESRVLSPSVSWQQH